MKSNTAFVCLNCQSEFNAWSGRCAVCKEWNTIVQQATDPSQTYLANQPPADLFKLTDLPKSRATRLKTGLREFDRVLGNDHPGVVPGSVILLAGNPGIGKSTLLLQVVAGIRDGLYFSAEESLEQLRLRVDRLGLKNLELQFSAERNLPKILAAAKEAKPELMVIDSIQAIADETIGGTPGSLIQVRENSWRLQRFAKLTGVSMILVGHVTKEGVISGPRTIEHLVDVVLYLEGEKRTGLRLLRAEKNRFGSTEEVGIWQLGDAGFKEVADPGAMFANLITDDIPGRALSVTVEGSRAFLIEVQALVAPTSFGYPKRVAQGIDLNRLNLLLAVLGNRLNLPINQYDVFVNIVGGFNLRDPGIDLALSGAILSGIKKAIFPPKLILLGEVGLLGEVRPAFDERLRAKEAKRLGFQVNQGFHSVNQLTKLIVLKSK